MAMANEEQGGGRHEAEEAAVVRPEHDRLKALRAGTSGAPRGLIERAVGMTSTSKEEPRLTKLKKEQAALRDKVRRTLEQCAQNRKP